MSSHPVLTSLPFLPLQKPAAVGPWTVTPLSQFNGVWADPALKTAAHQFLGAFRTAGGDALSSPAIVSRDGAVDGTAPTAAEATALRRAVGLGVVVSNPYWTEETRNQTWRMATADNADLWIQPLDVDDNWITVGRGSRISTVVGGHRLTDEGFTIAAPIELHMPGGVTFDDVAADAIYKTLTGPHESHHIRTAVDWLLKSWLNSASISGSDRVVYLKTAIEALTGESGTEAAGVALRELFESTAAQEGEGLGIDALLWTPGERTLTRTWMGSKKLRSAEVTELEHWYGSLADARNEIIHEGTSGDGWYRQPESAYEGPIIEIADRVTREAILVAIGNAGFPAAWRSGMSRASLAALRHLSQAD